jgi:hypothetical protein
VCQRKTIMVNSCTYGAVTQLYNIPFEKCASLALAFPTLFLCGPDFVRQVCVDTGLTQDPDVVFGDARSPISIHVMSGVAVLLVRHPRHPRHPRHLTDMYHLYRWNVRGGLGNETRASVPLPNQPPPQAVCLNASATLVFVSSPPSDYILVVCVNTLDILRKVCFAVTHRGHGRICMLPTDNDGLLVSLPDSDRIVELVSTRSGRGNFGTTPATTRVSFDTIGSGRMQFSKPICIAADESQGLLIVSDFHGFVMYHTAWAGLRRAWVCTVLSA